jgi:NADH-quinone oxidoreductase subunit G
VLGTNNLDHHRTADFSSLVGALTAAGATDRYATMEDVFEASSLLLIGNDPTHQHPLLAHQIRQTCRQHGARLYVINSNEIKLRRQASLYLRIKPGAEPEAVRALATNAGPSPELLAGGAAEDFATLHEKVSKESDTVIISGEEIQGDTVGELVRWGLSLPGRTRFVSLGDYANSRGAADMGLLPLTLPGYRPVADPAAREHFEAAWGLKIPATPGRNIRAVLDGVRTGEIKALVIFGSNPVKTFNLEPGTFGKLAFLLVAELFPTETSEVADVVLPGASFAEKSGTVTNTCGQIQALKKTLRLAGTRSDLEILLTLARLFGQAWSYNSPDDVLHEIITLVPGYAIALPNLLLGRAVATRPEGRPPVLERPDLVFSSRDSLFTSGTVSRYSWALNSVDEAKKPYGHIF